jgi:hypothetical protein
VGKKINYVPLNVKHLVLFLDKNHLGTYLPWETFALFFFPRVAVLGDEGVEGGVRGGRGGALSWDFSTRLASVSCNAGQSQRTEKKAI